LSAGSIMSVKSYIFQVEFTLDEEDGRWSAWIEALPGCTVWGHTKEEALVAMQDAATLYVEDMLDEGEELPAGVTTLEAPVVTVTRAA